MVRVVVSHADDDDGDLHADVDNNDGAINYDNYVASIDCDNQQEAEDVAGTWNAANDANADIVP